MENRYIKLFIALIISALFVFLSREIEGHHVRYVSNLPFINRLPEFLFELLHLVGIIFFFKFSYIWIKELWNLK
jgi:hypothetical protein